MTDVITLIILKKIIVNLFDAIVCLLSSTETQQLSD